MRLIRCLLPVLLSLLSWGCGAGYYAQAAGGHFDLMSRREPIDRLVGDDETPEELRARLELVLDAREFATAELGLPDNDSYRTYADLERPYVVWNVFAAPEFSLEPKRWCFPVAGCVVYRGYFREAAAERYAGRLAEDGDDVAIGGAAAYSTLGRFDDPVLNTMIGWSDTRLVAILFHELAHQELYVKGDSAYNEAFATAVEEEGLRRWLRTRGDEDLMSRVELAGERAGAFNLLVGRSRERLQALYSSGRSEDALREGKASEFERLKKEYAALKADWGGYTGYDAWFDRDLNNAHLIPVATYRRLVPAFRAILRESGGDLAVFYARCRELGNLSREARNERMERYLAIAEGDGGTTAR